MPVVRPDITDQALEQALDIVRDKIFQALSKHGKGIFASPLEALGSIVEEKDELSEAIRRGTRLDIVEEMADVGVSAIFGIASILSENS